MTWQPRHMPDGDYQNEIIPASNPEISRDQAVIMRSADPYLLNTMRRGAYLALQLQKYCLRSNYLHSNPYGATLQLIARAKYFVSSHEAFSILLIYRFGGFNVLPVHLPVYKHMHPINQASVAGRSGTDSFHLPNTGEFHNSHDFRARPRRK